MFIDLSQVFYLAILIAIGGIILYLRRRADGSKSAYKIVLILTGLIIASFWSIQRKIIKFDQGFLEELSILILVIIMFELSIRLNQDNISLKPKSIIMLFSLILANILILSPIAIILLNANALHAIIFSLIMTAIEYFFVDELRAEGDLANPLIILFAFSLLFFNNLKEAVLSNLVAFMQYILVGIGTGIIISIIVFKLLKDKKIIWLHEVSLVIVAVGTYLLTEQLNGSGLFAILIMGLLFGNSFIRQNSGMKSFSPFIFKSIEMVVFLMLGFIVIPEFPGYMIAGSLVIFFAYLVIRIIIISFRYRRYSTQNKILLASAPKGIVYATLMIVMGTSRSLPAIIINTMFLIIIYSLIVSMAMEYIELKKIRRMEHLFMVIKSLKYGRKKDLYKHRHIPHKQPNHS